MNECALGHPGFQLSSKAWFPYDRPDRRDRLSRFLKYFETIRTTGAIASFHMIVPIV